VTFKVPPHGLPHDPEHPVYVRTRRVPLKFMGTGDPVRRWSAELIRFRGYNQGITWDVLGTTRGHADCVDAISAAMRLAKRRAIDVSGWEAKLVRAIEAKVRGDG
jgi:hypothetical protein